jgi:DNA-binding transcriptional ArsR family regulator
MPTEWHLICSKARLGRPMVRLDRVFKVLGDPVRLRIVNLLSRRSLCVSDLQTILGLPQPFVSRHLALLRKAELARAERFGPHICYSLDRTTLVSYPLHLFLNEVLPLFPAFHADIETLDRYENSGRLKSDRINHQTEDEQDGAGEDSYGKRSSESNPEVAAEVGQRTGGDE